MTDDFTHRFGQLDLGPTHPSNPADSGQSLYDVHSLARRYDFRTVDGNAWAVDTKTRERAFRIDAKGRTFLPDGKEIATPKLTRRAIPAPIADRLYGQQHTRPAPKIRPDAEPATRLAATLYGPKK